VTHLPFSLSTPQMYKDAPSCTVPKENLDVATFTLTGMNSEAVSLMPLVHSGIARLC